jgi:glycosyltransferase involved in cell wall biosynthesis
LVDPADEEAVVEALRSLLASEELRAERSRRGLEQARRFSWPACARATVAAYRDALA